MKDLEEKIKKECKISRQLREDAWRVSETKNGCTKAKEIREEQKKHWDKFVFYKNMKQQLEKMESEK